MSSAPSPVSLSPLPEEEDILPPPPPEEPEEEDLLPPPPPEEPEEEDLLPPPPPEEAEGAASPAPAQPKTEDTPPAATAPKESSTQPRKKSIISHLLLLVLAGLTVVNGLDIWQAMQEESRLRTQVQQNEEATAAAGKNAENANRRVREITDCLPQDIALNSKIKLCTAQQRKAEDRIAEIKAYLNKLQITEKKQIISHDMMLKEIEELTREKEKWDVRVQELNRQIK